jgi:tRNA(fMet)-specific endonuclease VapC
VTLKYMLDTNSVSFALRAQGNVAARLLQHRPSEVCVSAVTVAELRYGADKRQSKKLHALIDAFVAHVQVVPLGETEAARYGKVSAKLERLGTPIGQFDTLISAHALALDLVLVTNNARHFGQVGGLRCEDWL